MSLFDLDTEGQAALEEEVRQAPIMADQIEPSFFEGVAGAIGQGVMRGGARTAQFLGIAASAPVSLYERVAGKEGNYTDAVYRAIDDYVHSAVDFWTPGPAEVGTAGRVLGGLSEIVLPLMAGGGNPTLMIGGQEVGTATDLVRQGVDPAPAVGVGIVQGAATAVGFKLPYLGKTLATRMASGAAGNLATNAGAAAVSSAALQLTGHEEQAAQFDPANAEARAVDVLTGLAFGGLAHASMRSSERVAILTAANARHFQQDTAPGTPVTAADFVAHQEAMDTAIQNLLRGDPVVAAEKTAQADFVPRQETPRAVPEELKALTTVPDLPRPADSPMPTFDKFDRLAFDLLAAESAEPVDPMVSAARQRLEVSDIDIPTGDFAGDGTPARMSAREFMAQTDELVARAKNDAKAFEAAVSCHMQSGGA